jgi:sulfoxide reductase heme-binding subunit YedZ
MVLKVKDWIKKNWFRTAAHVAALAPLAFLIRDYTQNLFLVDPVREITTRTGRTALTLLLLSLACTPIYTLTGFKQAPRVRRALGVYAFLYAGLHLMTFVGLDYGFDWELLGPAILDQRYVIVGFSAFLILLALAITSTKGWQRRLKKNWKRLHKLVYLASVLVIVHFAWLVKDIREPLRYGALVLVLLALRIPRLKRAASQLRRRLPTPDRRPQTANR